MYERGTYVGITDKASPWWSYVGKVIDPCALAGAVRLEIRILDSWTVVDFHHSQLAPIQGAST